MRVRYCILYVLICAFLFISVSWSAEDDPELPPRELIEEMLADEDLPDEIKRELEEMLESGEFDAIEEVPAEITPAEELFPPVIEEKEEAEEVEEVGELEAPKEIKARPKPEAKVAAPARLDKISLDLKGVDIIDVLKMLSARSNLNIVAGRNVRGRVTLFLKDVNVWDAFKIILASNNLAYVKEGSIINVMTERDYEQLFGEKYYTKKDLRVYKLEYAKAADVSKALNQAKSKIGKVIVDEASNSIVLIDSTRSISKMERMIEKMDMPIETRVFSLDYAKAEDIKTKLSEILTKGVGTIQVDERTNKVIIKELSEKMPEIANVIKEMDERHKQVLIEVKIIEIELNDQYQYGIDWKAAFRSLEDQGFKISLDDFSGNVWTGTTGGTVTLASVASRNITGVIEMLKTIGRTNVISSPRITVLNNEEARVLVGTEQPVVTSTTTVPEGGQTITAESVTYLDVGVELTVTPTINKDGYVTMKIKPEISSLGTGIETAHAGGTEYTQGNLVYPVSKSETETTVMIKDGHTIVIAGLIQDRDIFEEDKIPILGDIPLIGALFKNKSVGSTDQAEKKELVIFLTPYIIRGTETFPEAENTWYGDTVTQRELLEQQISLAVEDLKRKRSLVREIPPRVEEVDTTTRIVKDVDWFGDMEKLGKRTRKELEESLQLKKEEMDADARAGFPTPTNLIPPAVGGYHSYYDGLRNKIYWIAKDSYPRSLRGEREDVHVTFTLTKDGRLMGVPQVLNKVEEKVAKAAITAVKNASPFPPFPRRMAKESQIFRITLTYQ